MKITREDIKRFEDSLYEQEKSAATIDKYIRDIQSMIGKSDFCMKYTVQKNRGVSAARNKAIYESEGEYLYFMDSDDWIEKDCIERLVDAANSVPNELVCFPMSLQDTSISQLKWNTVNQKTALSAILNTECIGGFCCNKLFLKSIIDKYALRFDETLCYMEDFVFSIQYLLHVDRAVCCNNNFFYHYEKREDSASGLKKYNTYKGLLASIEMALNMTEDMISAADRERLLIEYANAGVWLNMYMFRERKYIKSEIAYNLQCAGRYYKYLKKEKKIVYWITKLFPRCAYFGVLFNHRWNRNREYKHKGYF